jgi:hypothetical protein
MQMSEVIENTNRHDMNREAVEGLDCFERGINPTAIV